jgi:hypothetical protein
MRQRGCKRERGTHDNRKREHRERGIYVCTDLKGWRKCRCYFLHCGVIEWVCLLFVGFLVSDGYCCWSPGFCWFLVSKVSEGLWCLFGFQVSAGFWFRVFAWFSGFVFWRFLVVGIPSFKHACMNAGMYVTL